MVIVSATWQELQDRTGYGVTGATSIDTFGFACKHDNLLVENGGWLTRKLPNGDTEWIPPPHRPLNGGTDTYHHPERFLPKNKPRGPGE